MNLQFQMSHFLPDNPNWSIFNTEGKEEPFFKKTNFENLIFHVRKSLNIDTEPNFHAHTTSNAKEYPGQSKC